MALELKEESIPLTNLEIEEGVKLQTELMSLLELEELFWFKRSHETWVLKGDNNTEFYHRVANGRRRKKIQFFNSRMEMKLSKGLKIYLNMLLNFTKICLGDLK